MPDSAGELPVPRHIKVLEPGVEPTKVYIKPEAKIPNIQEAILTAGQSGIEGETVKGQILKEVTRGGKKEYEAYPANPGEEVDWEGVAGLRIRLQDGVVLDIDKKHLSLDPLKSEKPDSPIKSALKETTPFTPPDKVSASVVSVFGDIKKNEDIEIAEARLEAEERMQSGKGEFSGGTFGERMKSWGTMLWKHNFWETAYKSRERIFSLLVHEQADLPTHVTREIFQKAEETARRRLDEQAKTLSEREQKKIKRKRGWDETEGFFTDVHNETLKVFKEWREELGTLADPNLTPAERNRIMNDNPLYKERLAWLQVSHDMADNIGNQILHAERGEAQFAEKLLIGKDTVIGKRLLDDIAKPLWQGMLAGGDRDILRLQAQEKLTTLFASQEFTSLLSTLPPEKQALLKSRNYGTTLIETFETIGKQVEATTDHQASMDRLNFDIELTLGVAEWGPRNKIETTVTEKRAKKNQELYNKLRNREPIWGNSADLEYASKRAVFLSDAAQDLLRNEVLWGTAVPALLYLPMRWGTSTLARFVVPVVGGSLVSGFIGGRKEYQRLAKERQVMNLEEALGQSFPLTMEIAKRKYGLFGEVQKQEKSTRRGELAKYSYHKRSMGEAITTLDEILGPEGQIEKTPTEFNTEKVKKLYATVIDLEARNAISDQLNINLLSNAMPDGSMSPQSFEIQKRRLDKLLSRARIDIERQIEFANNDPLAPAELKTFISDLSGSAGPKTPADLMGELVMLQVNALRGEVGLGDARYRMALGDLSVKEGQSLATRDMLFEKFRKWKAVKRGTQTAVVGAIIGAAFQEATNDVLHLIQTGHLEGVGPISGALHWIEGKGAAGPIVQPEFTQPAHSYGDGNMQLSDNARIDQNGNLDILNPNGTWQEDVIKGFSSHLKFNPNGTLDHSSIEYLQQQGGALGLHFNNAVDATTAFQAHIDPKDTYDLVIGTQHITVPSGLHFIDDPANPAGTKDLILSMNSIDGRHLDVLVANNVLVDANGMPKDPTALLDVLKHNNVLNFHDGQLQFLGNNLPATPDVLPNGIAHVALPDGTIQEIHALIPQGTHLVPDNHGAFNLVDSNNQVLLPSVEFTPDGHIANAADPVLRQIALAHGITLGGQPEQVTQPDALAGGFPKQVSDMGGTHGARGPWGWLEEPIQDPAAGINHDLPATNLLKNLFRGWTENQNLHPGTTYDTHYTSLQGEYIYHDLPKVLFENGQITQIGKLMDEAIAKFETQGVDFHTFAAGPMTDHDHLLLLAYEFGRVGRVPSADEMTQFMSLLPQASHTVNFFQPEILMEASQQIDPHIDIAHPDFVVNMLSVSEIPHGAFEIPPFPIIPLMARRPLEGYLPTVIAGEYPVFTEYPAYTEYLQQYPEFQEGYGYEGNGSPEEYQSYVPFYEHALESLNTPLDQRKLLRLLAPQERIKKIYELANIPFNPNATYNEQIAYLSSILRIPVTLEPMYEPRPREVIASRLSAQERYLDRLKSGWNVDSKSPRVLQTLFRINGATKGYFEEIQELNKQIPPMHPESKMTVVIPIFNEEIKIERSLTGWLDQYQAKNDEPINPEQFEIILFINRPNAETAYDGTLDKIDSIRKNPKYANFHFHVVEKTFNISDSDRKETINGLPLTIPKGSRMGLIFGLATDMAILRNQERIAPDEIKANYLLKTGGADAYARSPYYIDETLNVFDRDLVVEQYNSRSDYPSRVYEHVPLFYVTERFRDMMNELYTEGKSNLGLGVYRASLYSEAGGFNPIDDIAEEVRMNERMRKALLRRAAAQGKERSDVIRRDELVRAIDDPRRALSAVWAGKPMLHEYTDFWNNEIAKNMDVETILETPVPPEALLTSGNLKRQIEPYIQYYARLLYQNHPVARGNMNTSIQYAKQFTQKALEALGFQPDEYSWQIDESTASKTNVSKPKDAVKAIQISFNNLENLQAQIEEFKKKEKPTWIQNSVGDVPLTPPTPLEALENRAEGAVDTSSTLPISTPPASPSSTTPTTS